MQSVSSRIWTRLAVSISYDDNDYTTKEKFYHQMQFRVILTAPELFCFCREQKLN